MIKQGGSSSSALLNSLITWLKRDILRASADAADATRMVSLLATTQSSGLVRQIASLQTQLTSLLSSSSPTKALADFYANTLTLASSSDTSADISPTFGQAILPARSRQNVLVIERLQDQSPAIPEGARILYVRQPSVTSTANATPPPDFAFGEDLYSVFALDAKDLSAWIVEDPTSTGHVCWVEIQLPGDVSGAYRCNELEFIPASPFTMDLLAVQADILGQGWRDIDFSYLSGYSGASRAVVGLGPSRLCFSPASVRRFRLGLWCHGVWGFAAIRVLNAVYNAAATLAVDFSTVTTSPLTTVQLVGKQPGQLSYLPIQNSGGERS